MKQLSQSPAPAASFFTGTKDFVTAMAGFILVVLLLSLAMLKFKVSRWCRENPLETFVIGFAAIVILVVAGGIYFGHFR